MSFPTEIRGYASNGATAASASGAASAGGVTIIIPGSNAQTVADGAMASGSTALACATSLPFTTAMVGWLAKVTGAGNAAGTQDLATSIAGFTDAGHVILANACANTLGVTGATVYFGPDMTSTIQAQLNAAGDGVVKVAAGSSIAVSTLAPAQATLDLTGVVVYQIQPLSRAAVSYMNANNDATPQITRFRLRGGVFVGTGNEQQNQAPVQVSNVTDCTVDGTIVLGYSAYSFYFADCQRVRLLNTTTITTGNPPGAVNYINFAYLSAGLPANSPREIFCTGNYVSAPNGAVAAVAVTGQANTSSNSANPVRFICTDNNLETAGFDVIALESGGGTASTFYIQKAVIVGNIVKQDSTGAGSYCIRTVNDDSGGGSTDPALHQDILIAGNVCTSANDGIGTQADRAIIAFNLIRINATVSTSNGILCQNHDAAGISHNHVIGNVISQADGAGTGISFNGMTASQIAFNDVYWDTGATGAADAILMLSCTDCHSRSNFVRKAPGRAVRVSASTDCTVDGDYTLNPCAATGNCAVFVDGACAGHIVVKNTYSYDNRGAGAKMTFALNNASTGATCNTVNNVQVGAVTANTTGTWTALVPF